MKIILIEDNYGYRELIRNHLEHMGYKSIKEFSTVETMLEYTSRLVNYEPDLIFLDHILENGIRKGNYGTEMIPEIKKAFPDSKIVVLSGVKSDHLKNTSKLVGAMDYIKKDHRVFDRIDKLVQQVNVA